MKKQKQIIYEFLYCGCIHESSYATMSLHFTKKGATKAMIKHKAQEKKKFEKLYSKTEAKKWGMKFGQNEAWCVDKREILP